MPEFVAPPSGAGTAHGRTADVPRPGPPAETRAGAAAPPAYDTTGAYADTRAYDTTPGNADAPGHPDAPGYDTTPGHDVTSGYDIASGYADTEVADVFDVHTLPLGPVLNFPDARTAEEAELAVAVLERFGGTAVPPLARPAAGKKEDEPGEGDGEEKEGAGPRLLMSLTDADDALAHWAAEGRDHPGRPSVLLWFGHGRQGRTGPVLVVPDGGRGQRNTYVTPDMFAYYLHAEQQRRDTEEGHWAIVVIEACNSKSFTEELQARFLGAHAPKLCSLLLVGTGKEAAQAYLGAFRKAMESYLAEKSWQDEVHTLRELQLHLKRRVPYAELVGEETSRELPLRLRDVVPLDGATTVAEQQRLQREHDAAPAGPGTAGAEKPHDGGTRGLPSVPGGDETGFLEVVPDFTGRTTERAAVADWLAAPDGPPVLVVTGPPGTGKSALLGEVLRGLRRGGGVGPDVRVGAVLRLTGSTAADVTDRLAQLLGTDRSTGGNSPGPDDGPGEDGGARSPAPGGPGDPLEPLRRRLAAPAAGGVPTLILADALDEAREPFRVASLLRDLTEAAGVRLLVGTRTSPYETEAAGDGADLREALGSATGQARVLELTADTEAATAYAARRVERVLDEHGTADPARRATVVGTVRDAVEHHVREGSWQFLHVALAVGEIEQRPGLLADGPDARSALEQLLAKDRTGLFGAAVARITAALPAADALLRSLALAQGRGLPRADGVWAHAAAGVAGREDPVSGEELSLFLGRAAAYVLLDGEDRRSVYRPAHRTYTEQLLATTTPGQRLGLLTALLDAAAEQCAGGGTISPHLEARLAQYAADCGLPGWTELAARPSVLDRLPVTTLSGSALAPGGAGVTGPADLPIEVLGTVASAHLVRAATAADRPGLRQLGGLRATGRLHPAGPGAAWEVCWGELRVLPPHLKLGGAGSGAVSALTARPSEPWLATGALDGTVVVWEPWRAHRPALLMRGHGRPVSALASLGTRPHGGGPALLLAAHDDRTLHLWDTGSADRPVLRRTGTAGETVRIAAPLPGGAGRFALGGAGGYLALLDADGGAPGALATGVAGDVVGLTPLTSPDGRQWLAAAHRSGELVLWDVTGSGAVRLASLATRRTLTALTALTDADGTLRLATAAEAGPVELWRVQTRQDELLLTASPLPDPEELRAPLLAALPSPGGDTLVVGDADGTVRLLVPGDVSPRPAGGGIPKARTTAVLRGPGGGTVLATVAGRDPLVHLWAPAPAAGGAGASRRPRVDRVRRHVLEDGTEVVLVTESAVAPAGAAPAVSVRVLRAADGEDLTDRVGAASLPGDEAGGKDAAPPSVTRRHANRVMGWVELEGVEDGGGRRASLDRDGVLLVWDDGPSGSREPVRRISLGAPGLHLTALSGGRVAATTDDGIVVLAIAAVAPRGADGGTEETHG
ncbi:AAA family ATPase [Streptomyces omiyaensis]|uniref:AAA family ATPase n=1 Tax=Streptomyces omiyaensis TaxID=68247 RepID=UPI0016769660|nr:AAA family ATPase [Streptomyces omiyaensis]